MSRRSDRGDDMRLNLGQMNSQRALLSPERGLGQPGFAAAGINADDSDDDWFDQSTRLGAGDARRVAQTGEYSKSTPVVLILAVVMAFDYMVVFVTIYFYYTELSGPYRFFGLVWASYDLSAFVFTPILGYWADRRGFRLVLVLSTLLNITGNIVYAMAYTSGWWMILLGRLVSGAGSSNIPIIITYLTRITPSDRKTRVLTSVNTFASVARLLGPFVGIILTSIKTLTVEYQVGSLVLTQNTLPAWIMSALGLVTVVLVLVFVKAPPAKVAVGEGVAGSERHQYFWQDPATSAALPRLSLCIFCMTVVSFAYWAFFSQLIPIAGVEWHLSKHSIFTFVYVPVGVGAVLTTLTIRTLKDWHDHIFMGAGVLLMVLAMVPFLHWEAAVGEPLWAGFFYLGTGVLTIGQGLFNGAFQGFYAKRIEASVHVASLTALMYNAGAVSRFMGPIVWSAGPWILRIAGDESCCHFSTHANDDFELSCCEMTNINGLFIATLASLVVVFVLLVWKMRTTPPVEPPLGATRRGFSRFEVSERIPLLVQQGESVDGDGDGDGDEEGGDRARVRWVKGAVGGAGSPRSVTSPKSPPRVMSSTRLGSSSSSSSSSLDPLGSFFSARMVSMRGRSATDLADAKSAKEAAGTTTTTSGSPRKGRAGTGALPIGASSPPLSFGPPDLNEGRGGHGRAPAITRDMLGDGD